MFRAEDVPDHLAEAVQPLVGIQLIGAGDGTGVAAVFQLHAIADGRNEAPAPVGVLLDGVGAHRQLADGLAGVAHHGHLGVLLAILTNVKHIRPITMGWDT